MDFANKSLWKIDRKKISLIYLNQEKIQKYQPFTSLIVVIMTTKQSLWEKVIESFDIRSRTLNSQDEVLKLSVNLMEKLPHFHWTGIYWLNNDVLDLEYYVGLPTDHAQINIGQGVCGTAVAENRDIIIDDVMKIDNYLACSAETRSEIVVLIKKKDGTILGQIDVDSDEVGAFDEIDRSNMEVLAEKIAGIIEQLNG
jgi:GAF domain-containing protein